MRIASLSSRVSARGRQGFSLIEVLVAMTILMVIVLIVAGIFQSTSTAWSIGLRRADEQSATRAVIGAISRDLSMIVDPNNFIIAPAADDTELQGKARSAGDLGKASGSLDGSTLDFWILKSVSPVNNDPPTRELAYVSYSGGSGTVTRTETPFDSDSGDPSGTTSTSQFDLGSSGSVSFEAIHLDDTDAKKAFSSLYGESNPIVAVRIVVKPTTPTTIDDYEIHVGSCGEDGSWDTDDDIKPWVDD